MHQLRAAEAAHRDGAQPPRPRASFFEAVFADDPDDAHYQGHPDEAFHATRGASSPKRSRTGRSPLLLFMKLEIFQFLFV